MGDGRSQMAIRFGRKVEESRDGETCRGKGDVEGVLDCPVQAEIGLVSSGCGQAGQSKWSSEASWWSEVLHCAWREADEGKMVGDKNVKRERKDEDKVCLSLFFLFKLVK